MTIAKVGRRGQITIPRETRRWLKLEEGDQVAFVQWGDKVLLQPLGKTLLDLRGAVAVDGPQDWEAIRGRVLADHARRTAEADDE